ncbi:iron-containing alcohol dehydrogenase [Gloeophyllum trabeum ATCC 11539]|uniref:Iron-containing alcohol dehydrogenase n=1 Tax=Gloeophyllum trabeum (strain ATCC 11539 / FP-39264 / Madison 617) TaxID=670483 RepID=S7RW39_GLOTA|nr:iron-containing alcohol dehydrogenase [Gloeophyllum trabeum ATCC 11539]EPQ57494.1 iron-containing alcohol dehydrogenase [Gloeophyllum trabeum ATCC 11539]
MSALDSTQHDSTNIRGFYAYTDTLKGVFYGPGSVNTALPKLLDTLNGTKALIVTGKSLHDKTDVVKKVENVLRERGAYGTTFWEIGEHAPVAGIRKCIQALKECGADIVVSVGGGSPVDAAKAVIYFLQKDSGGSFLPHVAIPTTLSAAEYTIGAGYTEDNGHKVAVSDQRLAPAGIILDAELTLATPERLWLSTGMRAMDHAVENLYRPLVIPPMKVLCYQALADLFKYLPLSKADPSNLVYRQKLQVASWMSLWPVKFEKYSALGISHALGHKLGARYHIPHGITSCLTLAPTVALKAETASQEDKEWLAGALFHLRQPSTGSVEGDVLQLSKIIDKLVVDLGLKSTLAQYKVPREDLPDIAERAMDGRSDPTFPKVVQLLEGIYE